MPSPDRTTRSRRLALLAAVASLLGMGAAAPVRAQEEPAAQRGEDLFGTYQLDARGTGLGIRYEIEGLLPGGSPVIDMTVPETVSKFGSGPSGYGLASLAYPGGIPVNLGALVAQGGGEQGQQFADQIPDYPIKAEAFYPTGPVESEASQGGTVQKVTSGDLGVLATGSFPGLDAPPAVSFGAVSSASRSSIEGALGVSRTRTVVSDISILGGLITIDSVVTDLVAAHDGTTGSTNGGTVANGVSFLGLAATLNEDGLVLKKGAPVEGPAGPLGGALSDLADPLAGALAPVRDAIEQVLQEAVPQVNDLLAQAGVQIRIVDPHEEQAASGAATRISTGLEISFSYIGKEQDELEDLIYGIPEELRPNVGPIPNPIVFLAENHIYGVSLASGSVSSLATPPFPDIVFPTPEIPVPPIDPGVPEVSDPGFATPPAPLPPAPTPPSPPLTTQPASDLVGGALPAILVALALLASPFFGMGSTRLADNVLAPVSSSCPSGLDKPIDTQRPT